MTEPADLPVATKLGPDVHSYANFDAVTVEHVSLQWRVDFEGRALHGCVTHRLLRLQGGVTEALFDTRGVTVTRAESGGAPLTFDTPRRHAALGTCLRVHIPSKPAGERDEVTLHFFTQREPDGFQWFTPEQTLGKRQPYVFSQFQAILARTGLPCMDTPAVKSTVDYQVDVPSAVACACGGLLQGGPEEVAIGGAPHRRYRFKQPVKVPSYLIAVVAGDIQRYRVGGEDSRCFVWAEPELGPAAAEEFSDMGQWVDTAERVTGHPYEWGTYDVVVLPAFFAYGGMENPNLTCVNACIVAGDKSLVDVVMHEISHSWTGNLVTNHSWPDFWINEGFTVYFERILIGETLGEDMRQLSGRLGFGMLLTCLQDLEEEHRMLRPPMIGIDPDDAFSLVPYEKGFALLYHLETLVGGREVMLQWIQKYIKSFAQQTVTSEQMIAYFTEAFPEQAAKVDWQGWLYGTGLPPVDPRETLSTTLSVKVDAVANCWLQGEGEGAAAGDLKGWHTMLVMHLLDLFLERHGGLSLGLLDAMDALYGFSRMKNAEVQSRWLQLRLHARDKVVLPQVREFLKENGRGKYVRPVFLRMGEYARACPEARGEVGDIAACVVPQYGAVLHKVLMDAIRP
eukprot:TRINITY_DN4659_c0_g1_i2.p1 TRINITY_DN4659_c0_g1~~TRINITY_DN4659_c0_g1_i2.p1  ORF type:complete len:651 (+),score=204.23 TRINITY_DN4659_c0_g1_i2:84-1955(+)